MNDELEINKTNMKGGNQKIWNQRLSAVIRSFDYAQDMPRTDLKGQIYDLRMRLHRLKSFNRKSKIVNQIYKESVS